MRRNRRKEQPVARWVNQGQPAPTRRSSGIPAGSVFDPARFLKGEKEVQAFEGKEVGVRADRRTPFLLLNSSNSSNLKEESGCEEKPNQ